LDENELFCILYQACVVVIRKPDCGGGVGFLSWPLVALAACGWGCLYLCHRAMKFHFICVTKAKTKEKKHKNKNTKT